MFKYPLAVNSWDEQEIEAINRVINSGLYTMGREVFEFEEKFADYFGARYAVMVNSGSSANLLAIAALMYSEEHNIHQGDEVIVPAVSWATTYYPLHQYGLKLKFVDVDAHTLNIDTEQLKNAITSNTRAIFAVNLLGNPNYFEKLCDICKKYNLILIEDNCESMGAKYNGQFAGTFGVMGTFSTFFSHHISTMEGGMVLTNNAMLSDILKSLRAHGWTRNISNDSQLYEKSDNDFYELFNFILPGYNLRPLEIEAAIGKIQLSKLDGFLNNRRENGRHFISKLSGVKGVRIQKNTSESSFFGFSVILTDHLEGHRDKIVQKLRHAGIECRPIVAGNFTKNKVFKYFDYSIHGNLKNADYLHENGFYIGNYHYENRGFVDILFETLESGV